MKTYLLTTAAALGALSAMTLAAPAADLIEPPVYIEPQPLPVPVEEVSTAGWYIRGDVGYAFSSKTDGYYKYQRGYSTAHGYDIFLDQAHYESIKTDDAFLISGGLGYRFNQFARVDLTADYFSTDLRGSTNCAGYPGSVCRYDDTSDVDIWTVMANAYVDLGTYGRFTPYVGAGLGFANVSYGSMNNKFDCDQAVIGHGGPICGTSGKHEGQSSWRFAYGLSAGASVDITSSLKFDAGYKWTHIRGGEAYGFDDEDRAAGFSGVQSSDHGFDIHTIRAGLRYEFGGGGFGKGKGPLPVEPMPVYDPVPVQEDVVWK